MPEKSNVITAYDNLPTKFVQYKPPRRSYRTGRSLINRSRDTGQNHYFSSQFCKTSMRSAFPDPHTFFDCIPAEVRDTIYGYLVRVIITRIDGLVNEYTGRSATSVYQENATQWGQINAAGGLQYRSQPSNFMCISRQLFQEIRDVVHRYMTVVFTRRWDFLLTCGVQTLYMPNTPPVHNPELCLFSKSSNVLAKIRRLDIDLCRSSDFGNRIVTVEVERVTALLTSMIASNLPSLHSLTLRLNDCSRISFVEGVLLPEPTFVDSLLAIKQIKTIHLLPGVGWKGHGSRQKIFQHNLAAFELLMQRHYSGLAVIDKEKLAGANRWIRLANIGRLILSTRSLRTPSDRKSYEHAMTMIHYKVCAIEHGARR